MVNTAIPEPLAALLAFVSEGTVPDAIEDWSRLIGAAQSHEVLPQFCARVLGAPDTIPDATVDWCREKVHELKIRGVAVSHAIFSAERVLSGAGIPTLWLKGAALAHSVYPAFWMRTMVDVDVLVPYDAREQALAAMLDAGYRPYPFVQQAISHHYVFLGSDTSDVVVEVHYALAPRYMLPLANQDIEWFWSHVRTLETSFGPIRILQPEAMLLHLSAHDILVSDLADRGHSTEWESIRLRRKLDIHQLVAQSAMDWTMVVDKARAWGWEFAVGQALVQAQLLFLTPVPERVLAQLRVPEAREGALPMEDRRRQHYLQMLSKLSGRERARYFWRTVFPPAELMRKRYQLNPDDWLWPHYLQRVVYLVVQSGRILMLGPRAKNSHDKR